MTSLKNPPSLIFSIQDEVEKDCKVVRAAKHARTKKTFEKFLAIQKDLQQTISEVRQKENQSYKNRRQKCKTE
jgi:hypothetical protein